MIYNNLYFMQIKTQNDGIRARVNQQAKKTKPKKRGKIR